MLLRTINTNVRLRKLLNGPYGMLDLHLALATNNDNMILHICDYLINLYSLLFNNQALKSTGRFALNIG